MRWPSFNSSTLMTVISGKFAHHRQDRDEVSERAPCGKDPILGKNLVCFAPVLLYSSRRVTVAFAYGASLQAGDIYASKVP
jgi:hypothetical protein